MVTEFFNRYAGCFRRAVAVFDARSNRLEVLRVPVNPIEATVAPQDGVVPCSWNEVQPADHDRKQNQRSAVCDGSFHPKGAILPGAHYSAGCESEP